MAEQILSQEEIDVLLSAMDRGEVDLEQEKKKAAQAKKKIEKLEDDKKRREALQVELTKAIEDEASLKALIDDTPVQEAPPAKVVTLPDPRAAPEGARQALFLCANNRVYPIMADSWRDTIRKRAEYVVKSKRLSGGPKVGVDKERFLKQYRNPWYRKVLRPVLPSDPRIVGPLEK